MHQSASQDTHDCQRRLREYSWWRNQQPVVRRYGEAAQLELGVLQDTLQSFAALVRDLCKQVRFGIQLKHFRHDWKAEEVRLEHARLQAMLEKKAEARQAQTQGQGEPSSKRQRGGGGGAILNWDTGRRTSKEGQTKIALMMDMVMVVRDSRETL